MDHHATDVVCSPRMADLSHLWCGIGPTLETGASVCDVRSLAGIDRVDSHDARAERNEPMVHQSLLHAASPGTHPYDLLQVMASHIFDCSEWYRESEVRSLTLQQQLDDSNSKLLDQFNVQNAEILKLQDQLKTSQAAQDFYRHQALEADLIPPRRRCQFSFLNADDISPAQIYQQLFLARDDIHVRDRALARLQL
jgi:hypothetical protein